MIKTLALFLRGYGGSYRYVSDLSELQYGYGADLNYNAIAASVLLNAIEDTDHILSFGVIGSYGKISLQPQDVEESKKVHLINGLLQHMAVCSMMQASMLMAFFPMVYLKGMFSRKQEARQQH